MSRESELFERSQIGTVDEEAGAHSRLQVTGGEIMAVEFEHPLRGTAPGEAIGKTVNQAIVKGEHQGRVDRVRSRDRGNSRRCVLPC